MSDAIVAIEFAKKRLGRSFEIDIQNLEVPQACTLGLIGPNGAGKSTLLRLLTGMIRVDSGAIKIFGSEIPRQIDFVKHRIGYAPDSIAIYPWMRVRDVLRFCSNCCPHWSSDLAEWLRVLFKLDLSAKVSGLSKGMQTKLNLIVAIAHQPDLLLLDEPFIGLDPIARKDFISAVLLDICRGEQTVIISSHELDDIEQLADRTAVMFGGTVLACRGVRDLVDSVRRIKIAGQILLTELPAEVHCVRISIVGCETEVTVSDFTSRTVDLLRDSKFEIREVCQVSLADVFEDFVKGAEERCCES